MNGFFRTDKVAFIAKKQKKGAFLADFWPLLELVRGFVAFFFMSKYNLDENNISKV